MENLDKYSEVTGLNFDKEDPHLAICHKSQGYSANKRPDALLFKSGEQIATKEIIKSLEGVVSEKELIKMLAANKRKALEEALTEALKASTGCEHAWVWVQDHSDDIALFEYECELYATAYEMSDEGVVTFTGEISKVKRRDMYVDSETGEELVKAVDWSGSKNPQTEEEKSSEANGEVEGDGQETDTQDTPVSKEDNDEETMSDKKEELSQEDILKSSAVQDLVKAAVDQALAKKDEELQKAAKNAQTEELVKSFAFVAEEEVSELVKALTGAEDSVAAELVKAMSAAQEKIEALEAEVVKTKEDFGKQDSVNAEVKNKTKAPVEGRESALEKAVAAQLAKNNKK